MPDLVIIGAGLAGLTCAKVLAENGARDFLLLEANPEPGGRVRSERTADGYTLDRGFQVLLDSYPAVRRHLDLPALTPRYFDSGALLADPESGRAPQAAAHPLLHPADAPTTAFSDRFPVADKARLAALVTELLATPDAALRAEPGQPWDVSTAGFLFRRGFSPAIVERFLRPFFGGTYFPPADGHGRPGFPRVVQSIAQTFATRRDQVERQADELTRMIAGVAEPRRPEHPLTVDLGLVEQLLDLQAGPALRSIHNADVDAAFDQPLHQFRFECAIGPDRHARIASLHQRQPLQQEFFP